VRALHLGILERSARSDLIGRGVIVANVALEMWPGRRAALAALALASLLLSFTACQPSREVKQPGEELEAPGLEACLQQEAVVSLPVRKKEECISRLEKFLETRVGDPQAEWASFQLGRFYMEKMDFSSAYHIFTTFPDQYPASKRKWLARLHLGICLYYLDRCKESLEILQPLAADPRADSQAVEVSRYVAEDFVALRNLTSALAWYQRCLSLARQESAKEKLQKRVLEIMSQGWDTGSLQQASELFPEGFFAEAVRFGFAASWYLNHQPRLAQAYLRKVADRHPDDVFTPYVSALLKRLSSERVSERCAVGCLLPLTGKYEKFGNSVLDAMLIGARAFQPPEESEGAIRLVIRDTRGDPRVAAAMLGELARDPEVVGIVGPLLATEAQACAEEARRLAIPMITLSQQEEVAWHNDYVFLNGLTLRQQVDTLVEYSVKDLGLSRFAVLFPENGYGRLARDLFARKVQEAGGRLMSSVPYGAQKADFQSEIRLLVGDSFIRRNEAGESGQLAGSPPPQGLRAQAVGEASANEGSASQGSADEGGSSAQGAEASLPAGPPRPGQSPGDAERRALLPFDALFIPDDYRKISLIAPYLAFYDVRGIVLLGTSAWDSARLMEGGGEYLRDVVFVDGFFAGSNLPPVVDFVEEYRSAFGREPATLEALSYDSLMILAEAYHRADPATRAGVRASLAHLQGYPGLSGSTTFDAEGCAQKHLYLLSIQDNRIQQLY
jgi:branched-chain amino acid transport system substrate-binding protein